MEVKDLTPAQCVLLAVHLASEADIKALHSFTPSRLDALNPTLVLRIVLTYLPESVDPKAYTTYIEEVASRLYLDVDREEVVVDTSAVKDLSRAQAEKKVKRLELLEIQPPNFPPYAPQDILTRFICHRARRIDEETGLLALLPTLVEPFLGRNDFIRTWYISVVLPILRRELHYYPDLERTNLSLSGFERLEGRQGIDLLLNSAIPAMEKDPKSAEERPDLLGRDIKGLVGPWMYGHSERKRRKLEQQKKNKGVSEEAPDPQEALQQRSRRISLTGVSAEDKTDNDWEYVYQWIVNQAIDHFDFVSKAIDGWSGPRDVDLGGFDHGSIAYLDEDIQTKLDAQYAPCAFASCYSAISDSKETIRDAHSVLARLAELLDFIPPPDLAASVDSLPRLEKHAASLDASKTTHDLAPAALLTPEHPLTTPTLETYMLLQMFVYSAYQFDGLGHPLSLMHTCKLHFYAKAEEQLDVLRKILRHLVRTAGRREDGQWLADRAKLMWLWNWGIENDGDDLEHGAGILGKIDRSTFEAEMLKAFTDTNCFSLIGEVYIRQSNALSKQQVEAIIVGKVLQAYDAASNGNKTRGGVKKANDILSAFRPQFIESTAMKQASALIAATHALSFYALTLQHGVPFQPVSIRVSHDPIALLDKVLEQNPRSYTKLDDLVMIGRNLVSAGLIKDDKGGADEDDAAKTAAPQDVHTAAERRIIFMAVEAALREDDFETAYSYIVNRLTPSDVDIAKPAQNSGKSHSRMLSQSKFRVEDDVSWRAAFLAGRYRPSTAAPPSLRRLEQRTELLSLALLLAPPSALTEILSTWRRCEEETTSLQTAQQVADEAFNDRADQRRRNPGGSAALPGTFAAPDQQPALVLNQTRREVGRLGGSVHRVNADDTPLSMFDLTRNAARAFSKNTFIGGVEGVGQEDNASRHARVASSGSIGGEQDAGRVRKRDMVANAVSGGLASGLGWVLGATPVDQQQRAQQHE